MSFDKKYPNRKDWRKSYEGRGKHSASCRPNGGCPYCLNSRMHKFRKAIEKANISLASD